MRRFFAAVLSIAVCHSTLAALRLPFVIGDHMVVQREIAAPIWGWADAGQTVVVTFADQTKSAVAGADGKWMVKLDPQTASSEARDLTIKAGDETLAIHDVLIGDVWICSGQSNMEKPIGEQRGQRPTVNAAEEIAKANYPNIRLIVIPKTGSTTQPMNPTPAWQACSPASVESMRFSAVGYFFGRKVFEETKIPQGLIHSNWGGTRIERWIAPEGFAKVPTLSHFVEESRKERAGKVENETPSILYRTMITPIIPFGIKGVLWYQGESNVMVKDGLYYRDKMEALISGWREVWGQGDFAFYYVHLAPYGYTKRPKDPPPADSLPLVWEAQTLALKIPHTGMAVTTDLVDKISDIHPIQKREVGERLALWALARDYGRSDVEFSGPMFTGAKVEDARIVLSFNYAKGLSSRDGKPLTWFTIAGDDQHFAAAEATIEGDTIIVSSKDVQHPKFVRFAWDEAAMPDLVNGAGLPAIPFRTDTEQSNKK